MPIYEYRCGECAKVSSVMQSTDEHTREIACDHCGATAHSIISRTNSKLSLTSKVEKLDPKYDKLVDRAMDNTRSADPERYLKRMKVPKD